MIEKNKSDEIIKLVIKRMIPSDPWVGNNYLIAEYLEIQS